MVSRPHRPFAALALALAILPASSLLGCRSTYHVGMVMEPDNQAVVIVYGEGAFVTIGNNGPGNVAVNWSVTGDAANPDSVILGTRGAKTGRTVSDEERIIIETVGDEGATVHIEAQRAKGMAVDQSPSPRGD